MRDCTTVFTRAMATAWALLAIAAAHAQADYFPEAWYWGATARSENAVMAVPVLELA